MKEDTVAVHVYYPQDVGEYPLDEAGEDYLNLRAVASRQQRPEINVDDQLNYRACSQLKIQSIWTHVRMRETK